MPDKKIRVEVDDMAEDGNPDLKADFAVTKDTSATLMKRVKPWRYARGAKGSDVASAATLDLDAADGDLVDVTGTTTITAITLAEGRQQRVRFTGILTLTHGANLVLPTGANIVTAAGDFAIFAGYSGGVVRLAFYQRASGQPLAGGGISGNVGANDNRLVRTDGTGGSTIQGSAVSLDDSAVMDSIAQIKNSGSSFILGENLSWVPWVGIWNIGHAALFTGTGTHYAAFTANQNDWTPTSWAGSALRLSTDASRDLTGIVRYTPSQEHSQTLLIINVGSNALVLKHESASSSAVNRLLCVGGADITLNANDMAFLFYDATPTNRWRVAKL